MAAAAVTWYVAVVFVSCSLMTSTSKHFSADNSGTRDNHTADCY